LATKLWGWLRMRRRAFLMARIARFLISEES
jgi:hypothetical protein